MSGRAPTPSTSGGNRGGRGRGRGWGRGRGRGRGQGRGAPDGRGRGSGRGRPPGQPRAPRRPNKGLAIAQEGHAAEASLKRRLGIELPHRLGRCDDVCSFCHALHWKEERPGHAPKTGPYAYRECCQKGQVTLPVDYAGNEVTPDFLEDLLTRDAPDEREFRRNIRRYNNALSFTSLGTDIDNTVNGPYGVNTFRIHGALHHKISGLLPEDGHKAAFAQVYVTGDGATGEAIERATRWWDPESAEEGNARRPPRWDPLNIRIIERFMKFFYEHNPLARVFKYAGQIIGNRPDIAIKLQTMDRHDRDIRRYNFPTAEEVAVVVEGDGLIGENPRDIMVYRQQGGIDNVSDLHTSYLALRYPILLPYGTQGFDELYRQPDVLRRNGKITNMEWFANILFSRPCVFSAILAAGRLFQELLVDMYVCVEHWRLQYLRNNQVKLRAALYNGVVEALGRNDLLPSKSVILPSSFTGGARYMSELYHEAMSLVKEHGEPGYFITMTTNPSWPEIVAELAPGQSPQDRPDLIARVFNIKFQSLLDDVTKRCRLGKCLSYVYTIEFQKRALPHAHLILIMDKASTPRTARDIDLQVSADIPDPIKNPTLHALVSAHMIHGPCKGRACWRNNACKYGFPKAHSDVTTVSENSYPDYKRPASPLTIEKNGRICTNADVVSYNPYLLLRYECHINVEIPVGIKAVKYLYKYISKGHDRSAISFVQDDETLSYIDGRYVSAAEAAWRMFAFAIAGRYPAVQRLALHLEDAQNVVWVDEDQLEANIKSGRAARTTLTEFFRLNRENHIVEKSQTPARSLLYSQFPRHFTWNDEKREWTDRINVSGTISRTYFASIHSGERYYLRLLLNHVRGPKSFQDIRTVNGVMFRTYREAANELGLLLSDEHYVASMKEAASWQTGSQLRNYFAILLKHSPPADPLALWHAHKHDLSDDCERDIRRLHPDLQADEATNEALGLHRLKHCLLEMDMTLEEAGLPNENLDLLRYLGPLYRPTHGQMYSVEASQEYLDNALSQMNDDQKKVFDAVTSCLERRDPGLFYLDGPGGTGKTYVLNALLHYALANDVDSVSVASSGIAALLLLKGQTAHSALKVPLQIDNTTMCNFGIADKVGRRLKAAKFLVWDEIAMQNMNVISCVDRSLRDLRGSNEAFGGMCVLFSGDFRQTLPVIPRSSMEQQARASLKSSRLWHNVEKFSLHVNVRLRRLPNQSDEEAESNVKFGEWLLKLGSGTLQENDHEFIDISQCNVSLTSNEEPLNKTLNNEHYAELNGLIKRQNWRELSDYYAQRCILTPLNDDVNAINNDILGNVEGVESEYVSIDIMDEDYVEEVAPEVLNTYSLPSFPRHRLRLKPGCVVILLRNLNLAQGLCNGTRLVVTECGNTSLRCRIVSGEQQGKMLMLRKIKSLHQGDGDFAIPFYRYQFPIALAFGMTVNKAQGQSLNKVLVALPNNVFSHGQLYVALSRCTSSSNVAVTMMSGRGNSTLNIVNKRFLEESNALEYVSSVPALQLTT